MKYEYRLILRVVTALIFRPQIFYFLLTYPTLFFPFIILKIFGYDVIRQGTDLFVNGYVLSFVDACVASSAYYLLLFLVLLTKDIKLKTMVKMFLVGSLMIFTANIIRIVILIIVLLKGGYDWFNLIHLTFWYVIASFYVFFVWLYLIKRYKIKTIPVYSDVTYLISKIKSKKSKRRK